MGKRPDRAAKLKERSTSNEKVIKCKLSSHLNLPKEDKTKFLNVIENTVLNFSKRYFNATLLINLIIRRKFCNRDIILHDHNLLPDFTDINIIRKLLLGNKGDHIHYELINKYIIKFPELFENFDNRSYQDKNIYTLGANLLLTNITNHLSMNLNGVLKKYVYNQNTINKTQQIYILNNIYGRKVANNNLIKKYTDKFNENKEECIRILNFIRIKLLLFINDTEYINDNFKNYKLIIKIFVFVNDFLENLNEKYIEEFNIKKKYNEENNIEDENLKLKTVKLFNILPIAKIKNHFIKLDEIGLEGILIEAKLQEKKKKNSKNIVSKWLDLNNLINRKSLRITKEWKFTGTIETDGNLLCIHFIRKYKDKEQKDAMKRTVNHNIDTNCRVIAFDPGRTNILYGVEEISPNNYKTYKLTRKQYYKESLIFDIKKITEKENLKIKEILEELSENSSKSCKLENFMKYLNVIMKHKDKLYETYCKKMWSNNRFKLFCKKKSTISRFFNSLKNKNDKREIIIAYGSAKFSSTGNGEIAVPTSSVYKACKNIYKTNIVDEFRTSKIYHKDNSILKLVGIMKKFKDDKLKKVSLRGLLWYSSTNNRNNFVNRDLNAAINILNLSKCKDPKDRPLIFQRGGDALPKQQINKIIVNKEKKKLKSKLTEVEVAV